MSIDAILSHHMNPFRSGVARFNAVLGEHLGIPVRSILDGPPRECAEILVSFKAAEMTVDERDAAQRALASYDGAVQLYLHSWEGLELELRVLARAHRVLCGNHELMAQLVGMHPNLVVSWTPGLLLDDRRIDPAELTVFSFGMAHKLRVDHFVRLKRLLDDAQRSYRVYVSAANHETSSMRDAELIFREMDQIFPGRMYFLGNLSDLAVQHYLESTTFFAAFFERGVRANNTSVASALERGAVVLTNLDAYSPPEYVHMKNLIDVNQCAALPQDQLVVRQLSVEAMLVGRRRRWEHLVAQITSAPDAADPGSPTKLSP